MEQLTGQLDGITIFFVRFPDRCIGAALSYFRKASLLSISSIFLADHAPFLPDTACACDQKFLSFEVYPIPKILELMERPCAGKLARTVWSGGKVRDDIKDLPITIALL